MALKQQVRIIPFPSEHLTESATPGPAMMPAGPSDARLGGTTMEYEQTGSRKTQLIAMLMTFAVVGGVIAYVM